MISLAGFFGTEGPPSAAVACITDQCAVAYAGHHTGQSQVGGWDVTATEAATRKPVHALSGPERTMGRCNAFGTAPMISIGIDGSSHLRSARRGCPLAEHGEWVGGSATWPERHWPKRYLGFGHVCEMHSQMRIATTVTCKVLASRAIRQGRDATPRVLYANLPHLHSTQQR